MSNGYPPPPNYPPLPNYPPQPAYPPQPGGYPPHQGGPHPPRRRGRGLLIFLAVFLVLLFGGGAMFVSGTLDPMLESVGLKTPDRYDYSAPQQGSRIRLSDYGYSEEMRMLPGRWCVMSRPSESVEFGADGSLRAQADQGRWSLDRYGILTLTNAAGRNERVSPQISEDYLTLWRLNQATDKGTNQSISYRRC